MHRDGSRSCGPRQTFLERRRQSPPFGASSFDLDGLRAGMGSRQEPTVPGVKLTKIKVVAAGLSTGSRTSLSRGTG